MKCVTNLSIFVCIYELKNCINDMLNIMASDAAKDSRYAIFSKESLINGDPVDIIYMNNESPIKENSVALKDLIMTLIFGENKGDAEKNDIFCGISVCKNNAETYDLIIMIHNIYANDRYKNDVQSFIDNLRNSNNE